MSDKSTSLSTLALQKFKKNFWGVFSLCYILIMTLVAIFAYVIAPDSTRNANQMHLNIHSQSPGFKTTLLIYPLDSQKDSWIDHWVGSSRQFASIAISDYRIEADKIYYTEYYSIGNQSYEKELDLNKIAGYTSSISPEDYIYQKTFVLGTDKYGRDMLSRLIIGSRVSLSIGLVAVFISVVVGVFFGALGGYYGGKIDAFVMWLVNVIWSIPTLLLVIAITLALGKGFWQVFIAVGLTMWVEVARVVRGQFISLKQMQYVTAARALGYHDFRIIIHHILPNIWAPVIVISAANFASALLVESGLSFLGLGAQPPVPSWGGMIKDHYNYIILGKPYLALLPGVLIMSVTLTFMMLGNALRDVLDVKSSS